MTNLYILKDKIVASYSRYGVFINKILNFVMSLLMLIVINSEIGYMKGLTNPFVCTAIALLCSFLPTGVISVIMVLVIIAHLSALSLELTLIASIVFILMYLLYFRYAPHTGFLLLLTPILFFFNIPYVVPVIVGLSIGIAGIIPVSFGIFIYFLMTFASNYTTAISALEADSVLQNITFIVDNLIRSNQMLVLIVIFAFIAMMVYLIKRLSVNYSWVIAVVSGALTQAIAILVAYSVLSVKYSIVSVILGTSLAIIVGLALNLFIFSVDYSATEYVQFEDNDYYYYVKAVPKISVTSPDKKVKKINTYKENKGFVHTETYENTRKVDTSEKTVSRNTQDIVFLDDEDNDD